MSWYFICSIVRAERRLFVDNLRIHVIVDHRYLNFHNMESFYPLLFTMMWFMVFNATFNNISVISWWRKLEYPQKTTDMPQVTKSCIDYTSGFKLTTLVAIGTDCRGSCKSSYHTITTAPTNYYDVKYTISYHMFVTKFCKLFKFLIDQ